MTNKEAKEKLYMEWQKFLENNIDYAGISEAYKMAFKALEQEPCEDKGEISDGYHTFNQLYHQRAILFATIVNQNKDKAWKSFKHSDGRYCFGSNGEWFIVGVDTPQGSYTYHYSKEYWDYFDCKELNCAKEWDGHTEEDVIRLLSLEQEQMRDATPEERELVDAYIKSISKPIGVEFDKEPSGDAVSRKDVLKLIYDFKEKHTEDREKYPINYGTLLDLLWLIRELPPVTQKSGHWIIKSETSAVCSRCHKHNLFYGDFCKWCGTKMVKPKESEDKE